MVRAVDQLEFSRGFGATELLSLHEAACLAGLTVAELRSRIEDGPIEARIHVEDGVRFPGLTRAELARHCPDRYPSVGIPVEAAPTTVPVDYRAEELERALEAAQAELAELRTETHTLRSEASALRGELHAASQVERSLQRYVDRVETNLARSRRELAATRQTPPPARAATPARRREEPAKSHGWRRWFGRTLAPSPT